MGCWRVPCRNFPNIPKLREQCRPTLPRPTLPLLRVIPASLTVGIAFLIVSYGLIDAGLPPCAIGQSEEVGQYGIYSGPLIVRAGAGNPISLVGRDGLLGRVVAIQQDDVNAMLQQGQVAGVTRVIS